MNCVALAEGGCCPVLMLVGGAKPPPEPLLDASMSFSSWSLRAMTSPLATDCEAVGIAADVALDVKRALSLMWLLGLLFPLVALDENVVVAGLAVENDRNGGGKDVAVTATID